ncbi:MAG: beta-ketoacyl-[acyl-carrier-protein] synthase family protein, partial [Gallionella sp.]
MKKIVVTGLGCLTSSGNNVADFWSNMLAAKSGLGSIRRFDTTKLLTKIAGELELGETVNEFTPRNISRNARFSMLCADEALKDSGIQVNGKISSRIGISIGSGLGGLYFGEEAFERMLSLGMDRLNPMTVPYVDPNGVVNGIAIKSGIRGQQFTVSTACSSSANAIGIALDMIRSGRVDMVLAGGVEAAVSPLSFAGFDRLRAMSTRNGEPGTACRPFSKDRDGFVMAEGAAMLVLESEAFAMRRGARVYAELAGYGASGGAYHAVMSKPDGSDAEAAMTSALNDANVQAEQIDLVNPHGTGTKLNDAAEYEALKKVFGAKLPDIDVVPTKQLTGHLLGAAGAVEAV